MKEYHFYLRIFVNGNQAMSSFFMNEKINSLIHIIDQLGHSRGELLSFKEMLKDGVAKGQRTFVGYNDLSTYVNKETIEIGRSGFKRKDYQSVDTTKVFEYIDEAVEFLDMYNACGVPGIIPTSKKEELVIVPKEFVKSEYWEHQDKLKSIK